MPKLKLLSTYPTSEATGVKVSWDTCFLQNKFSH